MPELVSTRDPNAEPVPYLDALMSKASHCGLHIPEDASYPQFNRTELDTIATLNFEQLAIVVKTYLTNAAIPYTAQTRLAQRAYDREAFPTTKDGNIAPVQQIVGNLLVQQLSLGPTAAFKDFGLRSLAGEMNYALEREDRHLNILAGTSGDTGSAAEAAFKGIERVNIFMLSPKKGMSPFQQAQMGELSGENVHNLSIVDGSFDDCQKLVKDPTFQKFGAVNSINWGRIVGQLPYYFSGYFQAIEATGGTIGDPVDFVVPTGNFGNVFSGHVARSMGLPIRKLIIATNENNVIHRLVQTGEYYNTGSTITSSPSMDISVASNYERLVYEMFEGDPLLTRGYMREFELGKRVLLQDYGLDKSAFERLNIESGTSTHDDRLKTIDGVRMLTDGELVIDTHTADGVAVAMQRDIEVPTVCLATAAAVKFEASVREAIGRIPERDARFRGLEERVNGSGFVDLPNSQAALEVYLRKFVDADVFTTA